MGLRKAQKIDILSSLPLFERCSQRELGAVAALSVEEELPAGAVLTREGRTGGLAYVIVDGSVTARRHGRKVGQLSGGAVVGELSLIDRGPRTATVTADGPLRVLEINSDDFTRLVADSPRFTFNLLATLAARIRDADRRGDLRH